MSIYYSANKTKNLFDPHSQTPFKLSRSKIDLFLNCPRCFYLDRRLGISQPPGFPFNLNTAVDTLLKKEFDIHRAQNSKHPLLASYGLDLIPFSHPAMNEWRTNFTGVRYHHQPTNLLIFGAVDDVWVDEKNILYVVDYKSTSKESEVNIDADWQIAYKRQMEVYQWLLRQNGFVVSDTGYFVYCNGKTDREAFDAKLEFDIKLIPYSGSDSWIEKTITQAKDCLLSDNIPNPGTDCDYCNYVASASSVNKIQTSLF
ncbi:MAG: PD-(D/E)XK nuclease family protein [Patescibacteria group bacterium]